MPGGGTERVIGASAPLETAVVVVVDAPVLQTLYRETYPVMAEQGIPLHVTLLYPFVSPEALPSALPQLRAVLAGHEPFEFELTELRTFPEYIWIAPDPAQQFRAITASIQAAFPDHPHWYDKVIPHATLAHVEEAKLGESLERLRSRVDPLLPVRLVADEAVVLAGDGHWSSVARLPLGAKSG
jgi:2'-5' RNA ligase